ncbi:unnamed protein product [Brassica oleracea]
MDLNRSQQSCRGRITSLCSKRRYGKVYNSHEEHQHRFWIFRSNFMRATTRHQRMDPFARHGHADQAPILDTKNLPGDFDWRDRGAVTPVKNQVNSSASVNNSLLILWFAFLFVPVWFFTSLCFGSIRCDPQVEGLWDSGCNGGLMNIASEYTFETGGLMREEDYPYTGTTDVGICKFDKSKIVSNFSVVSSNEDQIAANLVKNGPLAVAINSAYMQTYVGGVLCPYMCSRSLNHGVLLVGYGSEGSRFKEKPYWIIKNSWGETWG